MIEDHNNRLSRTLVKIRFSYRATWFYLSCLPANIWHWVLSRQTLLEAGKSGFQFELFPLSMTTVCSMTEIDFQTIVSRSPWFEGLPEEALGQLAAACVRRHLDAGECIYRQGFPTTEVYCITKGRVRVSLHSPNGQEFALIEREPEAWFGEPGLLNDEGRVLEASAIDAVELLVIPREVVLEIAELHPLMYKNLFHYNMQTLRNMHQLVGGILFYPLKARVAGRLLYLLEGHGQQTEEGFLLDIKVSQNDFARLALGSRQRVNKIFRDWSMRGLVETRNDFLLVPDPERLTEEISLFE